MIRRSLRLRYLFGSSKDHSHQAGGAQTHHPTQPHDNHSSDHSGHSDHNHHEPIKEEYVIEGKGFFAEMAKQWLRMTGWEPDTPRSRLESTHFNEHLNIPILKEKPHSLYRYMTYVPFFVQNVEQTISRSDSKEINSDYIVPAPIKEANSVFVYESFLEGNALKKWRSLEIIIPPIGLILGNYPVINAFAMLMGYAVLTPRVYSASRVLVRRLDILPDKQQLRVQRVGIFGRQRIEYMNISDIEYVEQDHQFYSYHLFWMHNRHYVDRYFVFQNKKTGKMLAFDRDGVWSEEGLKHPSIF